MSATSLAPPLAPARAINPWFVAVAVLVPTFMEVLDTTIANVALRYISGGLSTAVTDSEWVITSYLAANAIVLPISGWLSSHLGRRNYFMLSITVFTIASALCGMATNLEQMILFRVIQGLAGGGLQPSSQGILLDSFPQEKQGTALSLFSIAALTAPVVGPALGGWLCVNYDWRWIFLINVPVGIVALGAAYALVRDPEYLQQERASLRSKPLRFDYIGLGILALVLSCWEVILSKGQEWDWLSDPFWRMQTLIAGFIIGMGVFVVWELNNSAPIVNLRVLRDRNLAVSCIVLFCAFAVLYASSISLPSMLQGLFGYDALQAGLVLSPAGLSSICALIVAGALLARGVDARYLVAAGLLTMAAANYWMSHMNLEISPGQVVQPRMLLTAGLGLIVAPISVAAYMYIPTELRGAAIGLASLLRNEGGSVGTSMAQTMEIRREQFHTARLNESLDPLNPMLHEYAQRGQEFFYTLTGDPAAAQQMTLQSLFDLRHQQAAALSYFDVFWLTSVVALVLVLLLPLMKRSVAEKGAHIAAE
jgi:DHA2 family multidrug resistance protein